MGAGLTQLSAPVARSRPLAAPGREPDWPALMDTETLLTHRDLWVP